MCMTCGCGQGVGQPGPEEQRYRRKPQGQSLLHYISPPVLAHAPGISESRIIQIEQDIRSKNDAYAAQNRQYFRQHRMLALNLMSSPGAGKTTLLIRSINNLKTRYPIAVIEGDQQTSHDAERIRSTGIKVVQINTGKGCHLDARMVERGLGKLPMQAQGILFIENVGNLVCPAEFDLGEAHKVVILSVTEGEDKPLKYPDMFHAADIMILNKVDLLPYVEFDIDRCIAYARRVNPEIEVLKLSARTGEGLEGWHAWLDRAHARVVNADPSALAQNGS